MGITNLKCTSCGGPLRTEDNGETYVCEYCNSVMTPDTVRLNIKHSGTVKVDGIAGVDTLLDRAFILRKTRKFEDALVKYQRILEIVPTSAEAYWGVFLCTYEAADEEELINLCNDYSADDNMNLALEFSEGELHESYALVIRKATQAYEDNEALLLKEYKDRRRVLTIIKYIVRVIFYIAVGGIVAAWFMFFRMEAVLAEANAQGVLLPDTYYDVQGMAAKLSLASSVVAILSNWGLVYVKDELDNLVFDWFKYVLYVICGISALVSFLIG